MTNAYDFKNGIFYVTDYNGAKKKKVINEQGKLIQEELGNLGTSYLILDTQEF